MHLQRVHVEETARSPTQPQLHFMLDQGSGEPGPELSDNEVFDHLCTTMLTLSHPGTR